MLVSRVQDFINRLSQPGNTSDLGDIALLKLLNQDFSGLEMDKNIKPEHMDKLLSCYESRWNRIVDSNLDYTSNPSGINVHWIKLAQEMAGELGIPYLQILIPVLKNEIDPDIFSRLDELSDPRALFLGEDDVTWHRVRGFFEQLQQSPPGVLAIHDTYKSAKPRALTIKELSRLKNKNFEQLTGHMEGKTCKNIWNYLIEQSIPNWKMADKHSGQLITALLEMIDAYKRDEDNHLSEGFRKALKYLQLYMTYHSLEEVNQFYGIEIKYQEKSVYLFEILVDCWQESNDLDSKLKAVAVWLAQYDASIIANNQLITNAYRTLKVGPDFDINQLQKLVNSLDVGSDKLLKLRVERLKQQIDESIEFNPDLIDSIAKIYEYRWQNSIDTAQDYIRLQTGINESWIVLARNLAGAKLIHANYYRLLMPTLMHDYDFVTGEILTYYPLSSFILTDDNSQLIYLNNCVQDYLEKGVFYNCNTKMATPLTMKEKQRLVFAAPDIYQYYQEAENIWPEGAISKDTVEAIKTLVNDSLYPVGLVYGNNYDEWQDKAAWSAYANFSVYLESISKSELGILYRQRVLYNAHLLSFGDIMSKVQEGKASECVAVLSQHLVKLVIDYNQHAQFSKSIEAKVDVEEMRQCSAQKVYSDYDHIDQNEAIRRIMIIFISLMTHKFSLVPLTGVTIRKWNRNNTVTKTGKAIFSLLEPAIDSGDYKSIRFIYMSIIEHVVKPALADHEYITSWTRYNDTYNWLRSIENGALFRKENANCFHPSVFIMGLLTLRESKPKFIAMVDNFIEKVIYTMTQSQNQSLVWFRIHIQFTEFFARQEKREQMLILKVLRDESNITDTVGLYKKTAQYLIQKTALLAANNPSRQLSFFPGSSSVIKKEMFDELKQEMEKGIEAIGLEKDLSMDGFLNKFMIMIDTLKLRSESQELIYHYLHTMSGQINNSACATNQSFIR